MGKLDKKGIIITGANGFIGKHLVRHFEEAGHDVWPWTRRIVDLAGDGTQEQLQMIADDNCYFEDYPILIHAATYDAAPETSDKDPNLVLEMNLRMFMNILDISHHFEKVFYFGSGAEAFHPTMFHPEASFEIHPPGDQYSISKFAMNSMAKAYGNIVNLRLFGVYGPGEDWRYRRLSNLASRLAIESNPTIEENCRIDYLWVGDLCRIVEHFVGAKGELPPSINVSSGSTYEMEYYYKALKDQLSLPPSELRYYIEWRRYRDPKVYGGSNGLLCSLLPDDFEFTPHAVALKELYDYYVENKDMIKEEEYAY